MESTLDYISQITEFNDIHEFMKDQDLDEALSLIVKIMMKPDIPSSQAVVLISKLQAMSAKFGVLATWYTTVEKGPSGSVNNTKKHVYYTMKDSIDKLVDSLKYVARYSLGA
jgi:spore maturation protein SpmB